MCYTLALVHSTKFVCTLTKDYCDYSTNGIHRVFLDFEIN